MGHVALADSTSSGAKLALYRVKQRGGTMVVGCSGMMHGRPATYQSPCAHTRQGVVTCWPQVRSLRPGILHPLAHWACNGGSTPSHSEPACGQTTCRRGCPE